MNIIKFQCDGCGYYWEIKYGEKIPENCPQCESKKIYKAAHHRRFAKKSRPKLRRSYTF